LRQEREPRIVLTVNGGKVGPKDVFDAFEDAVVLVGESEDCEHVFQGQGPVSVDDFVKVLDGISSAPTTTAVSCSSFLGLDVQPANCLQDSGEDGKGGFGDPVEGCFLESCGEGKAFGVGLLTAIAPDVVGVE